MTDHRTDNNKNEQQAYIKALNEQLVLHALPKTYLDTITQWLEPIASNIASTISRSNVSQNLSTKDTNCTSTVLGVQGTQGSGKSTASEFLKLILKQRHGLCAAVLSIDDFYLTREERKKLSTSIHPLLETRGVPGTHDITLAINTIKRLKSLKANEQCALPSFNKSIDDRSSEEDWKTIEGPVDLVILEGWCVGLNAENETALHEPVNNLEKNEDSTGKWRKFANNALHIHYPELFNLIDLQLVLRAPSFKCVYNWRLKQEQKLIAKVEKERSLGIDHSNTRLMSETEITRFIAHYQRLTEHALESMPKTADWCLWLDEDQSIQKMTTSKQIDPPTKSVEEKGISYLVSTDLDGTLLDHDTYSWEAALPSLQFLKKEGVPIVINTSKTYEEVTQLQKALNIGDPFIVENGSALYLTLDFLKKNNISNDDLSQLVDQQHLELDKSKNVYRILFGQHRNEIINLVYSLRRDLSYNFTGYSDWSKNELMLHTGLTEENAELSMKRLYSEPMLWNDTETALIEFSKKLKSESLSLLKGGRFYHVLGRTNKAKPVLFLKELLSFNKTNDETQPSNQSTNSEKKLNVIALGDSPNDKDMLEIAEYPVWVKSPKAPYPKHNCKTSPYLTQGLGPQGWHEAITHIFKP